MIPSRRDGTVSSRPAGKLAEARCCVYMKKFTSHAALKIEHAGNFKHINIKDGESKFKAPLCCFVLCFMDSIYFSNVWCPDCFVRVRK